MEMLELRRYVPVFTYRLFLNLKGKNRPVLMVCKTQCPYPVVADQAIPLPQSID